MESHRAGGGARERPRAAPHQAAFRQWSAPTAWVRARWTPPDEHARVGEVPAPPGSRAGTVLLACADRSGPLAGTPLTGDVITAIAAGILAVARMAVVLLGVARSDRWLLARRRLAAWEAAWISIGPQWSRRE